MALCNSQNIFLYKFTCISTVRPQLSNHVGWDWRLHVSRKVIWPDMGIMLKHSKFSRVIHVIMYLLIATVFVTNYCLYKIDIE